MNNENSNNYYRANEDLRFKLTTPEEEAKLFLAAKKGDANAREFLIKNHLLYAARFARRANRGRLPDDEVISAVNAALMNAIDRFDPAWGNRFTRYLTPFLRGAIAGLWKERNVVTPSSHSDKFPTFTPYKEHDDEHGNDAARIMPKAVQQACVETAPPTDEIVSQKEELGLNLAMLKKCKCKLTRPERELLTLIYDVGQSMADIARDRGVSRQAVHAAHGQIITKLRKGFRK
jgi:RNA polymerase sigma factor (sigma-70 family)